MTSHSNSSNMFENFASSMFKLFALLIVYLLQITSEMPYLDVMGDKIVIKSLNAINEEMSKRGID